MIKSVIFKRSGNQYHVTRTMVYKFQIPFAYDDVSRGYPKIKTSEIGFFEEREM